MKKITLLLAACLLPAMAIDSLAGHKKKVKHSVYKRKVSKEDQKKALNRTLHEKGFGRIKDTVRIK